MHGVMTSLFFQRCLDAALGMGTAERQTGGFLWCVASQEKGEFRRRYVTMKTLGFLVGSKLP